MSFIRSVYQKTRQLQTAVKDAARFREITSVLVRYGFGYVFERMRLRGPLKVQNTSGEPQLLQYGLYRRMRLAIEELGPTFIKFGQILSTRPDVVPYELVKELESLQDHVAPLPIQAIREQIKNALGNTPEVLFLSFDEQPLASASIAQVHRAKLKTGEQVVLKIQRTGIKRKIESDLNILYFLAKQIESVFPETRLFNLLGIVQEFEHNMTRETDFLIEASHIERFRRNFAQSTQVVIPAVYTEHTSTQILTLEFIEGKKATQILTLSPTKDLKPYAKILLNAAYQMLYVDGFFHGDAHPGNVFILDEQKIALIDFGMVGKLSHEMRERVVDIVFALLNQDLKAVARAFYELGTPEERVDYQAYENECVEVLESEVVGRPLSDINMGGLFIKICQGAIKYRIRMPIDFTMMFKAMVTAEGLAKMLAPDIDVIEEARPYILRMIAERYSFKRLSQDAITDFKQFVHVAKQTPQLGSQILKQLEEGRFKITIAHESLERLERQNRHFSLRQEKLLLSIGLLIAGVLALSDQHFLVHGLPFLSILFLSLGVLLSLSLFFKWIRF